MPVFGSILYYGVFVKIQFLFNIDYLTYDCKHTHKISIPSEIIQNIHNALFAGILFYLVGLSSKNIQSIDGFYITSIDPLLVCDHANISMKQLNKCLDYLVRNHLIKIIDN